MPCSVNYTPPPESLHEIALLITNGLPGICRVVYGADRKETVIMAKAPQNIVSLDQQKSLVKLGAFEMENPIVFAFFDKQPEDQRDEILFRAIYIGVLALMEDRLSSFLSATQNELGTRLESLKQIFEMKKEIFYKTAVKGMAAEGDIIQFLQDYFKRRGYTDTAEPTGTQKGIIPGNKTGDVLCGVDGQSERRIVIEVKFDKSYKLGDIQTKDIFTKKADTAWSQILEAKVNRDGQVGIIVFDRALVDASITKAVESVGFIRGVGFIVIVNSQNGDYTNLAVAYELARDIVVNARDYDASSEILTLLVKRVLRDLDSLLSIKDCCKKIGDSNRQIMETLARGQLSLQFTLKYLEKYLTDGTLTQADLYAFYAGEDVKKEFAAMDVNQLLEG